MSWIATADFDAWIGGQFHLRTAAPADEVDWPDWPPHKVDVVSSDSVISVACLANAKILVTVITENELGVTIMRRIHSQDLHLYDGRMGIGTSANETVVVFDGRPAQVELHIFATKQRDQFQVVLPNGVTGRALVSLDDEGDDLLDVPRPADVPGAVAPGHFRGPGGPLLVVVRHHHTGEERLVSGRAWIGRFDAKEWGHIAFVPATVEAVRLSRHLARSPSNVLGRGGDM